MEIFEFLMVLMSIIVGLGIATLLTGVADLLRDRQTVRFYWLHSTLILMVFLGHLQVWWESWGLQAAPEWTFLGLMMMLGSPVCLFLIAHLLFPEPAAGVDLTGYYFEASTAVWLLGAGATTIGTLFKPVVFRESIFDAGNIATVPTLIVCLALASTRNRRVHSVLVPALLLVIFLDIVLVTGMQR